MSKNVNWKFLVSFTTDHEGKSKRHKITVHGKDQKEIEQKIKARYLGSPRDFNVHFVRRVQ